MEKGPHEIEWEAARLVFVLLINLVASVARSPWPNPEGMGIRERRFWGNVGYRLTDGENFGEILNNHLLFRSGALRVCDFARLHVVLIGQDW